MGRYDAKISNLLHICVWEDENTCYNNGYPGKMTATHAGKRIVKQVHCGRLVLRTQKNPIDFINMFCLHWPSPVRAPPAPPSPCPLHRRPLPPPEDAPTRRHAVPAHLQGCASMLRYAAARYHPAARGSAQAGNPSLLRASACAPSHPRDPHFTTHPQWRKRVKEQMDRTTPAAGSMCSPLCCREQ